MPEVAVLTQQCGVALHGPALFADGRGGVEPHPHRHGVDEQTDHGLHTGQLRRPARHRDPENHVAGVGQPGQHQRPRHLHQGVDGDAAGPGLGGQPRGGLGRHPQFGGARQRSPLSLGRLDRAERGGQQGGTGQPGQVFAPNPLAGLQIAAGQPTDVVAIGPRRDGQRRRIAAGPVQGHQLVDEHRQRPAVDHDVMGGQHQTPMRIR